MPRPVPIRGLTSRPAVEVLPSATTISPRTDFVRVTGNTTIQTITPPDRYFTGPLFLYNTDATVGGLGTTGNIALAVAALTRYKLFVLIYDPSTSKWYPTT